MYGDQRHHLHIRLLAAVEMIKHPEEYDVSDQDYVGQIDESTLYVAPYNELLAVMLSPRGQAVLEAKILSSASKICPRPQTRPRAFVLGLSSNILFWPRENECNAGIGNFDSQYITNSITLGVIGVATSSCRRCSPTSKLDSDHVQRTYMALKHIYKIHYVYVILKVQK